MELSLIYIIILFFSRIKVNLLYAQNHVTKFCQHHDNIKKNKHF